MDAKLTLKFRGCLTYIRGKGTFPEDARRGTQMSRRRSPSNALWKQAQQTPRTYEKLVFCSSSFPMFPRDRRVWLCKRG